MNTWHEVQRFPLIQNSINKVMEMTLNKKKLKKSTNDGMKKEMKDNMTWISKSKYLPVSTISKSCSQSLSRAAPPSVPHLPNK